MPSFKTVEEMSAYQANRELEEAMRVQRMSPEDRFQWLTQTWGRLQRETAILLQGRVSSPATARCYVSFEEKNRFESTREIEAAMALQHQRGALA